MRPAGRPPARVAARGRCSPWVSPRKEAAPSRRGSRTGTAASLASCPSGTGKEARILRLTTTISASHVFVRLVHYELHPKGTVSRKWPGVRTGSIARGRQRTARDISLFPLPSSPLPPLSLSLSLSPPSRSPSLPPLSLSPSLDLRSHEPSSDGTVRRVLCTAPRRRCRAGESVSSEPRGRPPQPGRGLQVRQEVQGEGDAGRPRRARREAR